LARRRIDTRALLVRSVAYGEADVVATFFTESDGKLAAIARGAQRSSKRLAGALEPIHELALTLEDKGSELCTLKEARIARPRTGLVADLEAMEAAGRALRWVRHLCPARTPEPGAWRELGALLGRLDARPGAAAPPPLAQELAVFGLRLLAEVGYGLELERCARCGRPCPPGRAAHVTSSGLVCSQCGGSRRTMSGELRALAARAARGGNAGETDVVLGADQAATLLAVVEDALAAHTDFDGSR
jgi:DNA repair protein RecO (recombination protein O)